MTRRLTPADRARLRSAAIDALRLLDQWAQATDRTAARELSIALRGAALRWRKRRQDLGLELDDWEPTTEPRRKTLPGPTR